MSVARSSSKTTSRDHNSALASHQSDPVTILAISLTDAGMAVGLRWRDTENRIYTESITDPAADRHSERLLECIDELITGCGLTSDALSAIAFDAGPGGFTRVRIACAVAQGIAMGLNIPVAPVDSLQAIALASARETGNPDWIVCTDARMGQCYVGHYTPGANKLPEPVQAAHTMDTDAVPDWIHTIQRAVGQIAVAGSAFDRFDQLSAASASTPHQPEAAALVGAVLDLASAHGDWLAAAQAAPHYVREKVALNVDEQAALRAAKQG